MKAGVSAIIIAISMMAAPVWSAPDTVAIKENQHYQVLDTGQAIPNNQLEVLEFFSFACPHCAHLEPTLQSWRKTLPKGVTFRRVPVIFRPQWENLAKVYYTLDGLKLAHLEPEVFKAIHEQNLDLSNTEEFMKWLGKHKVDEKKALMFYESFTVSTKVSQAKTLAQHYRIEGVPLLIVGGRYKTDVAMAGGAEKVPDVLNQLINIAQKKPFSK